MSTVSIIIPAYNSAGILPQTLQALRRQTGIPGSQQLEVVVVNDGSTDKTVAVARQTAQEFPHAVRVIQQDHQGAAAARLAGLRAASGTIVIFLGADILLRPSAIAHHLVFHAKHDSKSIAAVGYVRWDPRLPPTPLMQWMVHGGPQNDIDNLAVSQRLDPAHYFYGSHLSLKREFALTLTWNAGYRQYGWEDFDLGRQFAASGGQLYPLPPALGLHHHFYTPAAIINRQRQVGRSLVHYAGRYPEANLAPRSRTTWLKYCLYRYLGIGYLVRALFRYTATRWTLPRFFLLVTAAEQWTGFFQEKLGKTK